MRLRSGLACVAALFVVTFGFSFGFVNRRVGDEEDAPVPQVAVLPFQNVDEAPDISAIGDELAENIGTALNKVGDISVVGQETMRREVLGQGSLETAMKFPDVLLASKKLNIQTLVVGKYQRVGTALQIECSFIDVQSGKAQDAKTIKLSGEFQTGYVGLLRDLPEQVSKQFRPSAASTSRPTSIVPSEVSNNFDAHQLFATGLQRSKFQTIDSLTQARDSYRDALKKDADYGQAYAARSDAEIQIAKLKEIAGQDAAQEKLDAVKDALSAVKSAPYYGGAHWQLSRAYELNHDYKNAELAARVAAQLWPSNGAVLLDLSRAIGQGPPVDCPEFRKAVSLTPSLVLVTPDLPKVTVVNGGAAEVQVTFAQATGHIFTSLKVPSGGSRIVGLLKGTYKVITVGGGEKIERTAQFDSDTVYTIDGRTLIADTPDGKGTHHVGPATLIITSDVSGAKVLINGKEIGSAPMEWVVDEDVAPDWLFKIEISADGYQSFIREYHTAPGGKVPVKANLKPKPSFLVALSGQSGNASYFRIGSAQICVPNLRHLRLSAHYRTPPLADSRVVSADRRRYGPQTDADQAAVSPRIGVGRCS